MKAEGRTELGRRPMWVKFGDELSMWPRYRVLLCWEQITKDSICETGRILDQTTHKAQVQSAVPDWGILVVFLYAGAVPSKRGRLDCRVF